jgi:hypothetical protein
VGEFAHPIVYGRRCLLTCRPATSWVRLFNDVTTARATSCHTRGHVGAPAQVEEALRTASEWEFDAFRLSDTTRGSPLAVLGFYLFHECDFIAKFSLDAAALAR